MTEQEFSQLVYEHKSSIYTVCYMFSKDEDEDADTQQIKLLYKRVHRLRPFDRALVLLWLEGIPYDEIGAITGISAKYVSVRLSRIRQELKNMKD